MNLNLFLLFGIIQIDSNGPGQFGSKVLVDRIHSDLNIGLFGSDINCEMTENFGLVQNKFQSEASPGNCSVIFQMFFVQ